MSLGFRVSRIQSRGQGLESRLVRDLELAVQILDLAVLHNQLCRSLRNLKLQIPLVFPILENQPTLLQRPLDGDSDLLEVEWLCQVVCSSQPDGPDGHLHVNDAGYHDYLGVGMTFLYRLKKLDSI